jgi:tetratricopeptide (TPR) repeat protein
LARSGPVDPAAPDAGVSSGAGRRLAWPAGLFLLALVLRLLHLASILDSPFFSHLGLDPLAYDEWGRRIAGGDWLGNRIFYQDPLYPYFLGVVYRLAGHHYAVVILVQCVLGALIPPLVYEAARRWFAQAEAAVAGLLAAVYLPAIYYEGLILKTWLGAFLVAAGLWALSHALSFRGRWRLSWIGTGALLALACLVRGNVLLFFPVLAAWFLLDRSSVPPPARPAASGSPRRWFIPSRLQWQGAILLLAGVVAILGTTALRNRVVGGQWVLTTSQGGQNFYIGNNPANQNGRYDPLPFVGANPKFEEKGFAAEAQRRTGREMRPTEISRYWFSESFRWIGSRPGDWLRLQWLKLRNYWGAYEVPDNLDYYLYREEAPVLRLPLPGFGLLTPLALLGAALAWRRRGWPRALLLFLLVYSSSVILFFVFSRYRLPMMPAMMPFAGHALVESARRVRAALTGGGSRRPALVAVGLGLAFFLGVNLPVSAPAAYWSYRLAERLHLPRRLESTAAGHYNLGLSYAEQAKGASSDEELLRLAASEFREALRQDSRYAKPYAELGKVLARLEENDEAIRVYLQVIRMEPGRPRPHHVLGILHRRVGDLVAAEDAFRQALALDPGRLDSTIDLGEVLLEQGRRQEAAEAFRRALRLAPDDLRARDGLRAAGGTR